MVSYVIFTFSTTCQQQVTFSSSTARARFLYLVYGIYSYTMHYYIVHSVRIFTTISSKRAEVLFCFIDFVGESSLKIDLNLNSTFVNC